VHPSLDGEAFDKLLSAENVVKSTAKLKVSIDTALFALQLHNNYIVHDEWFGQLFELYRFARATCGMPNEEVLRVLLLCAIGRSKDVLTHCMENIRCCETHLAVHQFVMSFQGLCGDGSSTDTSVFGPAGTAANSRLVAVVLSTFTDQKHVVHKVLNATTELVAIEALESIPTYGGTGFKAKNLVHIFTELDKCLLEQDPEVEFMFGFYRGPACVRVGPNPRSFLNLVHCRHLSYGRYKATNTKARRLTGKCKGDAATTLLAELKELLVIVAPLLPTHVQFDGVEHTISPMSLKTLQFVLCKVFHVLQFCFSGKTGRHKRRHVLTELGEEDEDETD
jgi:hypothetical protein